MIRSVAGALLFAVSAASIAATPSLFKRVEPGQGFKSAASGAHAVEVDRTALRVATRAGGLRIDLPGGKSVFARTLRQESMPDDNLVWVGTVSLPKEDRNVVITMGRDAVFGTLVTGDGSSIELETLRGATRLVVRDPRFDAQRLFARRGVRDYVAPSIDTPAPLLAQPASLQQALAAADPPSIDLLVAYTPGLVTRYGSVSAVTTRVSFLTAVTNQALQDSKVPGRFQLVGTVQVDYSETEKNTVALDAMTDISGTGPLQPLREAWARVGADVAVLLRGFLSPEHGNCGYAPINGFDSNPYTIGAANNGKAAVSDGDDPDSNSFCNTMTFAHELGHAMGLVHNVEDAGVVAGAFPYAYGWRMTLPDNRSFRTVMSYGSQTMMPYYANPNVYYCKGMPCGDPATADQARVLIQTMPVMAAFRQAARPVIDLNGDANADMVVQGAGEMAFVRYSAGSSRGKGRYPLPAGRTIAAIGDLNGDLKSELLLTGSDNQILVWTLNAADAFDQARAPDRADGDVLVGTADLNGDGKDDLLFVNPATNTFTWWQMNGLSRVSTRSFALPAGAYIAATGDFDGDRRVDLMVTNAARQLTFWKNTGTGFTQASSQSYAEGWRIVGSGDFGNDKRQDLVLNNVTTGAVEYWQMNGAVREAVTPIIVPTGYRVGTVDRYSGGVVSVMLTSDTRNGTLLLNTGYGAFNTLTERYVSVTSNGSYSETYPSGWNMLSASPRQL
jgi:hypothetical protein